jgi:hypothetical protein
MKHLRNIIVFLVNQPYPFSKDLVCEAGKIGSASQKLENSEMIKQDQVKFLFSWK